MKNKIKTKKYILDIVCIFMVVIMFYSGYKIVLWFKDNNQNKELMNKIYEQVIIEENEESDEYNVDISELYKMNPDCVGWIKVEGTDIEYPIVKTTDNEFYLTHTFDKSYNKAGWIFVDYRNALDGTDENIVIYGHNRKDGSMFDSLKRVLTDEWFKDKGDMKIYLILGNELHEYRVFSAYTIEMEEYYLTTQFIDEKEFEKYIKEVKSRSIKNFQIDVNTKDKLLTLSTCADNNKYRVVVHAKKIN